MLLDRWNFLEILINFPFCLSREYFFYFPFKLEYMFKSESHSEPRAQERLSVLLAEWGKFEISNVFFLHHHPTDCTTNKIIFYHDRNVANKLYSLLIFVLCWAFIKHDKWISQRASWREVKRECKQWKMTNANKTTNDDDDDEDSRWNLIVFLLSFSIMFNHTADLKWVKNNRKRKET